MTQDTPIQAREFWIRLDDGDPDEPDTIWNSKPLAELPEHIIHVIEAAPILSELSELRKENEALKNIVNNDELLEIGRLAVQARLIEWRDDRLSVMRNNGLVIKERDGTESSIIRMGPEDCLRTGLEAILTHLSTLPKAKGGGNG